MKCENDYIKSEKKIREEYKLLQEPNNETIHFYKK